MATKIDPVEQKKLAMSILDLDGDGRISRSDFEKLVERKDNTGRKPADLQQLKDAVLKMCDALGLVGSVSFSYEEYRTHVQQQLQNPVVEDAVRTVLSAYFDALDADKNGYITPKEYRIFMESLGHADPNETDDAFKSIDTSGDGKIQRSEWINYAFEYFFTTKNDLGSENLAGSRCCCCRCCCCCPCCCCCRRW